MTDDRDAAPGFTPLRLDTDLSAFRAELEEATRLARGLGAALGGAFDEAAGKGRALDEVLRGLALRLARIALEAALAPLTRGLGAAIGGAVSAAAPARAGPAGMAVSVPEATGRPPAAGGSPGGEIRAGRPLSVTVNIATPDVEGFRRAQGQVAADMARALERAARFR